MSLYSVMQSTGQRYAQKIATVQYKVLDKAMPQSDWQTEMRKGAAEMYVLSALSGEAAYGYKITQILEIFRRLRCGKVRSI